MTRLLTIFMLAAGLLAPVGCSYDGSQQGWEEYQEDVMEGYGGDVTSQTSGLSKGSSNSQEGSGSQPSLRGLPISPLRILPGSRGHGDPKTW